MLCSVSSVETFTAESQDPTKAPGDGDGGCKQCRVLEAGPSHARTDAIRIPMVGSDPVAAVMISSSLTSFAIHNSRVQSAESQIVARLHFLLHCAAAIGGKYFYLSSHVSLLFRSEHGK